MSLDFFEPPEIAEIIDRIKTYVKSELEQLNPTDKNCFIYSLIVGLAGLSNDMNKQILLDILPNCFPQYCKTEEALSNFADLKNVPKTLATASSGNATIEGNVNSVIPLGTVFVANNKEYKTTSTTQISSESIDLSSLTVNGTLVTATTVSNHRFASNIQVTIAGATETRLNGTFTIVVNGLDTFTYSISQSVTATETTGLTASADIAVLNLSCNETGSDTNLSNGDTLAISTSISGVSSNAYTQYSGISGGSDDETFKDWQSVVVERYGNPITYFNKNNIIKVAKSVSGVSKVWVYPITPAVGQTTVYFVKKNNVVPDANELALVGSKIRELRTVKDDPDDVFVYAPTIVPVNFVFSAISPNTATMKEAIQNSLIQLFEDSTDLGTDLTEMEYNNAIGNSYDLETGKKLQSYTLTNPSSDVTISTGELPVLGTVTFL